MRVIVQSAAEPVGHERRDIIDGITAPTPRIQRRLAWFSELDRSADLELLDAQVDADRLEIVLQGRTKLRWGVGYDVGVKAIGITGLSQKLLGPGRVVRIFHGRRYVAAELARETGRVGDVRGPLNQLLGHRGAGDRRDDLLPHLQLGHWII